MKNLDFPKGKADQGEDDIDCAIREIREEIQLDVSEHISDDQYIQIQTMSNKWVKLYLVQGIPENSVNQKLTKIDEV